MHKLDCKQERRKQRKEKKEEEEENKTAKREEKKRKKLLSLRVELKTSRLLNGCSNQLSYESYKRRSWNYNNYCLFYL